MSEPSKEALERARALWAESRSLLLPPSVTIVATALQELMDAAAEAELRLNRTWEQHDDRRLLEMRVLEKRAEKAEADYLQVAQALGYAECPEGQDGWHTAEPEVLAQRLRELETRSVIAEERLAELVQRVREWAIGADVRVSPWEALPVILAEFEVEP